MTQHINTTSNNYPFKQGKMSGGGTIFRESHPRQRIPELSAQFHRNQWFVGNGAGGFLSIKQG